MTTIGTSSSRTLARDKAIAEDVWQRLTSDARVFLDSRCLDLGDDWDVKLREAQNASLITLVLVSDKTDKAYYQREEVAAAIALARSESGQRVIPVYLDKHAAESKYVPFGLRLKHGVTLDEDFTLDDLRREVLSLHSKLTADGVTPEGLLNSRSTSRISKINGTANLLFPRDIAQSNVPLPTLPHASCIKMDMAPARSRTW